MIEKISENSNNKAFVEQNSITEKIQNFVSEILILSAGDSKDIKTLIDEYRSKGGHYIDQEGMFRGPDGFITLGGIGLTSKGKEIERKKRYLINGIII